MILKDRTIISVDYLSSTEHNIYVSGFIETLQLLKTFEESH